MKLGSREPSARGRDGTAYGTKLQATARPFSLPDFTFASTLGGAEGPWFGFLAVFGGI